MTKVVVSNRITGDCGAGRRGGEVPNAFVQSFNFKPDEIGKGGREETKENVYQ